MRSAATIIIATVLLLNCGAAPQDSSGKTPTLRIFSYNIRHGEGMDRAIDLKRIADVISKSKPDLVALQEVDKNCRRSGNRDIAAELGRRLKMNHKFARFMDYQGGEYGLAVLSRFPIKDSIVHALPKGAEPRCALEVRVEVEGLSSPVSFVSIHNDWTKEKTRVKQVRALLESLGERTDPIILAGDFNARRTGDSMNLLKDAGWKILEKTGKEGKNTFPSVNPRTEIDFFVIRNFPEASITHGVIDEQVASDHRPIHATLSWLAPQDEKKEEWIQLFNGKDLKDWKIKFAGHELGDNYNTTFKVEDGVLKVDYDKWEKFDQKFGHIFYKTPFSHYRLRVEYRFVGKQVKGGPGWAFRNNGLMIHCQSPESMRKNQDFPVSIEVQLLGGREKGKRSTLNLCTPGTHVVMKDKLEKRHCINSTSKTYRGDQWVTAEIEVRGNKVIKHILDGKTVLEYTKPQLDDSADAKKLMENGAKRLIESGYISLQAESHPTEFRKIEVLKLEKK